MWHFCNWSYTVPKQSLQYPDRPWPLANLRTHPRFESLDKVGSMHKDAQLKYAMWEVLDMIGKFENGISWNEFLASQPSRSMEVMEQLAEELVRMRVFVMDYTGNEARLIPATQMAAAESERIKSRSVSINMPLALLDRVKGVADRRHQSVSGLVVSAIEEFLGEAAA